jgi:hypothetical protein
MAEAEFGVVYEGPAVANGQMPVKDLAPALLALGDLFTEASLFAFPERDPASLNIKATGEGSFIVNLGLHSPEAWDQIITLLSGKTMTALVNLQAMVFSAGGLLWLMKQLRGQVITSEEPLESGRIRITLPDGTTFEVMAEALALYERETARSNARRVIEPLRREGVERVEFTRDDQSELVIDADEVGAFDEASADEEVLGERIYEAFVTIVQLSFDEKYKWRLTEGGPNFTADFADESFRERMKAREELFGDGDRLRVRMRAVQTEAGGSLKEELTILEVLDHEPRKDFPQSKIDFGEND